MERVVESVTLRYTNRLENSDKVYRIDLIEVSEGGSTQGYKVIGFNGRYGSARLTPQVKIGTPTSYRSARAAFDELEGDKRSPSKKTPYWVESRSTPPATAVTESDMSAMSRRGSATTRTTRLPRVRDLVVPNDPPAAEEAETKPKQKKHRMDVLEF